MLCSVIAAAAVAAVAAAVTLVEAVPVCVGSLQQYYCLERNSTVLLQQHVAEHCCAHDRERPLQAAYSTVLQHIYLWHRLQLTAVIDG